MSPCQKLSKVGNNNVESDRVQVSYRPLVGSLLYAAQGTRLDIAFTLNLVSRYCEDPRKTHWFMLKNIPRYLQSTANVGIVNQRKKHITLSCYSNSDYGGCLDTRRSTSGWVTVLDMTPVMWKSSRQSITVSSTCEAEFTAASTAAKDVLWVRNLLEELGLKLPPTQMFVGNQGSIKLIQNNHYTLRQSI